MNNQTAANHINTHFVNGFNAYKAGARFDDVAPMSGDAAIAFEEGWIAATATSRPYLRG